MKQGAALKEDGRRKAGVHSLPEVAFYHASLAITRIPLTYPIGHFSRTLDIFDMDLRDFIEVLEYFQITSI